MYHMIILIFKDVKLSQLSQIPPVSRVNEKDLLIDAVTDALYQQMLLDVDELILSAAPRIPEKSRTRTLPSSMQEDPTPDLTKEDVFKIVAVFFSTFANGSTTKFTEAPRLSETNLENIIRSLDLKRQVEHRVLFETTQEALETLFEEYERFKDPIQMHRLGPRIQPRPLAFDVMLQKTADLVYNAWEYSLRNGENLDELLIQDFKKGELTWQTMEEDMNIQLKDQVTGMILSDLLAELMIDLDDRYSKNAIQV